MRPTFVFVLTVAASAPAAIARPNVAIINIRQAVLDTADGRAAARGLEDRYREPVDRLKQQAEDSIEVRRQREDLQREIQAETARLIQDLGKKMTAVVAKYAQRKHYEAVLDVSDPNSPVMWFKQANDITKEVIAEYDRTYSRQAAPTRK